MSDPLPRRLPLSPRARKIAAFGTLLIGVLVIGRVIAPVAPRETDVRVRLANLREPPAIARALTVRFEQRGELMRSVSVRFGHAPPIEWRGHLTLAQGNYRAVTTVELTDRVVSHVESVDVAPGTAVELTAPLPDDP